MCADIAQLDGETYGSNCRDGDPLLLTNICAFVASTAEDLGTGR